MAPEKSPVLDKFMNPKRKKYYFYTLNRRSHEAPARAIAKYLNKHKNDEIETILFGRFWKE